MKNSWILSCAALFVAAVGVVIALAAYFKHRRNLYGDDDFVFDDDDFEYYSSEPESEEAAPANPDGNEEAPF